MLAVLAEFERDMVSERTSAALQYKRTRGERVGEIPFGYALAAAGVHLEADAGEQRTLTDLLSMRAARWSWQRVADKLNARGTTTKNGRAWTWQTARKAALAAA